VHDRPAENPKKEKEELIRTGIITNSKEKKPH
jgi:hypothetical protein